MHTTLSGRCPHPLNSEGHLQGCAKNSPWILSVCKHHPNLIANLETNFSDYLATEFEALKSLIKAPLISNADLNQVRDLRSRIFAAIALCDLSHRLTTAEATSHLSYVADLCLQIVLNAALRQAKAHAARRKRDTFQELDDIDPAKNCGLSVYAVGKLGAGSLNYSSDVDLVVFYDNEVGTCALDDPRPIIRLVQDFVGRLQERTSSGYLFRTDLRLRPDPGATPIAMSLAAGEDYYATRGQNWERAAMVRARGVAGDPRVIALGDELLNRFVWRRNLDFVAIGDIMAMKAQINTHAHLTDTLSRTASAADMAGYNIKIGIGGIREIEFFVQTQQLIYGGRLPEFRGKKIEHTLKALSKAGHIPEVSALQLTQAWWWLRDVEHRLQVRQDEQTHSLPDDLEELEIFAHFCGYENTEAFGHELSAVTNLVCREYGQLFTSAPQEDQLVFTGVEPDAATLNKIRDIGFSDPEKIWRLIVGWHRGTYRCLRHADARALLTSLHGPLLRAFARVPRGNRVDSLLRFDALLEALPQGMQPFALLLNTPAVLHMLVQILATPTDMSKRLAARPSLFESLISEDFWQPPTSCTAFKGELNRLVGSHGTLEEQIDALATLVNDARFQCQVHTLLGRSSTDELALCLTALAETAVQQAQDWSQNAFIARHGNLKGGALCLVAMGKFGGGELSPFSDLDLMPITQGSMTESSDGKSPLTAMEWGIKLTMRVTASLSARTRFGTLYDVDTRLRPQGKSGPPAASREAFLAYFAESAWVWEHMALTRARPITGPVEFRGQLAADIHSILCQPRDAELLLSAVRDMRTRMKKEHSGTEPREVKHRRGGLIDIEFLCQYLQLRNAHEMPQVLHPATRRSIHALGEAGILQRDDAYFLQRALGLWLDCSALFPLISNTESAQPYLENQLNHLFAALSFPGLDFKGREIAAMGDIAEQVVTICSAHMGVGYDGCAIA